LADLSVTCGVIDIPDNQFFVLVECKINLFRRVKMQVTKDEAKRMVEGVDDDKVFTVTFVKRSNGKIRVMNCRKGVKKHLKGGEKKYDPKKKNLVCVFDMDKKVLDYRSIALESILKISMRGEVFDVV
jgi:hypothetical protein